MTLWLSADATDAWRPSPSGRPGAPKKFSDCAIETALALRLVFRLPLRQAEGFLRSVLSLMGVDLEAPDHTTLSRRSQSLAVEFRRIPSRGPIHLIVDSTGLSIVGEGEWAAVKHGGRGHRGWKKLHLAVDRVGVIVAHALTEPTVDDATIGIDLIETVDDEIARVTADAAYDTVAFYEAAGMRDATVVVPVWSKNSCGRSVVELQEAPETLAASHGPVLAHLLARKEEEVALPLVVPLAVEVFDVRAQRGS